MAFFFNFLKSYVNYLLYLLYFPCFTFFRVCQLLIFPQLNLCLFYYCTSNLVRITKFIITKNLINWIHPDIWSFYHYESCLTYSLQILLLLIFILSAQPIVPMLMFCGSALFLTCFLYSSWFFVIGSTDVFLDSSVIQALSA